MGKPRFKTKLTRTQKRRNILIIFAVVLFAYIFTLLFCYSIGIFDDWSDSEIYGIGLFMTFFVISMTLFPIMIAAIMLGLQRGRAKRVRDDSTYVPVQDIDYYRDSLSELTPAFASLLIDLDIYGRKDIVATLLRMQKKGVIALQQPDGIFVNNQGTQTLDTGERELLYIIHAGKLQDKKALSQWKENRFYEAERLGYIEKVDVRENNIGIKTFIGVMSFIGSLCLWGVFLASGYFYNFGTNALKIVLFLLAIDCLLFTPIYLLCRTVSYKRRADALWRRTQLGNELAEKAAGLGRFIHEFSLLSEARKEQIALWDDYLIYAIVLEENEQIVEEISKLHNVQLGNIRLR